MKILLIDDDPFALAVLARQLHSLGCLDVTKCEQAQHALALLESVPGTVDLIFCDLQMPGLDGVEFIRQLERIAYRGGLVIVSGEETRILQSVRRLARAQGVPLLGAFQKPIPVEQLRKLVSPSAPVVPAAASAAARPALGQDELRYAIDSGELVNHYQPQVSMKDGALIGVEALVRWQHPQEGLVYPDRFISQAESWRLIDPLTRVVLGTALRQLRSWHDTGLELQVAVNVSMDSLVALGFPEVVELSASEAGVPLSSLVLEVTESRLMTDMRRSLDVLTRLRLKRIGLSIDDFGTGHSSLAQLRDIPFNELKLDRSFIGGVAQDASLAVMVRAMITMAHQLGMMVVAEGVEDRGDWEFLRSCGCDCAQGYFIGRPMPGSQLPAWSEQWELRRPDLAGAAV